MELTGPLPALPSVPSKGGVYSKNGKCLPVQPATSGCMGYQPPAPLPSWKLLNSAAAAGLVEEGFLGSSGGPCSAFHSGSFLCQQAGDRFAFQVALLPLLSLLARR